MNNKKPKQSLTKREKFLLFIFFMILVAYFGIIKLVGPTVIRLDTLEGKLEALEIEYDTATLGEKTLVDAKALLEDEKKRSVDDTYFYKNLTDTDIDISLQKVINDNNLKVTAFSINGPNKVDLNSPLDINENEEVTNEVLESPYITMCYSGTMSVEGSTTSIISAIDSINSMGKSCYVTKYDISYDQAYEIYRGTFTAEFYYLED